MLDISMHNLGISGLKMDFNPEKGFNRQKVEDVFSPPVIILESFLYDFDI